MHRIAPARIAAGALVAWAVAGGGSLRAAESGPCAELAGQVAAAGEMDSRQISQALFKAADRDCAALADQLLQHGASPHARDGLGRTALIRPCPVRRPARSG